jgi:oligopeptidase A
MAKENAVRAIAEWRVGEAVVSPSEVDAADFEAARERLAERFMAAFEAAKAAPEGDWAAFDALDAALRRMEEVGGLLDGFVFFDKPKFGKAGKAWEGSVQKLAERAKASRAIWRLTRSLAGSSAPAGKIGALHRSSLWGSAPNGPKIQRQKKKQLEETHNRLLERFRSNVKESVARTWVEVPKTPETEASIRRINERVRARAKARAAALGKSGWVFAAEGSAYIPFMENCTDRKLRETMYKARASVASERGNDRERDNTELGREILRVRARLAKLGGSASYAEHAMEANTLSPQEAEAFLLKLAMAAAPDEAIERELARDWAKRAEGSRSIQPWDWRRAFEALREEAHGELPRESREFFPLAPTLEKACALTASFLGAQSERRRDLEAKMGASFLFDWRKPNGSLLARLWIEPWRDKKKSMVVPAHWRICVPRGPQAGMSCISLTQMPGDDAFNHDELTTLLHELGHAAHSLGAKSRWGEKDIAWIEADMWEFHSQFFERLGWDEGALAQLASKPLPEGFVERLRARKRIGSASELLAGIAESLCDLRLHGRAPRRRLSLWDAFNRARQEIGLAPARGYRRFFQSSFAMLVDYSCQDYSYEWTNALAAQAFGRWRRDREKKGEAFASARFSRHILEPGTSRGFMDLFEGYCGAPSTSAYWSEKGFAETPLDALGGAAAEETDEA